MNFQAPANCLAFDYHVTAHHGVTDATPCLYLTPMQSIEDFEPTGAFEAIKVLGRELQHSKEKIKNLENDIREVIVQSMFSAMSLPFSNS